MEVTETPVAEFLRNTQRMHTEGLLAIPEWGEREWSTLFACTELMELDAGDVLIQPREKDRALYFVASGRLQVAWIDQAGLGMSLITTVSPGSVVGELAFFDAAPRSAKVWAVAKSRLLKLSFQDYERYVSAHLSDATAFLFAMARLLACRVRQSTLRSAGP